MGKGNGTTRGSRSTSANGLSNNGGLIAEEKRIRSSFTGRRTSLVDGLQNLKERGKVGELANAEITKAIARTDDALKRYESINSITDIDNAQREAAKDINAVVYRLEDMAKTHEANANDATGRSKQTYGRAAMALRQAAYEIRTQTNNNYGNEDLVRLWDVLHQQNKW